MKRKAMLMTACVMMIMNTVIFLYLDHVLKQEISVYVIQMGRYKKEENANQMIEQLKKAGYQGYRYQDKDIVVLAKIVCTQDEANQMAKEISQKGMSCVVKEYQVDQKYKNEVTSQKYEHIYEELKS